MEHNGLKYILKLLKVSPTKMSQVLNIDRTLISKWKSGTRKVDINNEYFEKLLDYLIFLNTQRGTESLEQLLITFYGLSNQNLSSEKLKFYLNKFIVSGNSSQICSEYLNKSSQATSFPVNIYNGPDNQKTCILDFLDYAEQSSPASITFIYGGVFDKYMEDTAFRYVWLNKLIALLNKGFKLDLIFSSYKNAYFILLLPSLVLHKHCTIRYYHQHLKEKGIFALHMLDKRLLIFSLFNDTEDAYCNYSVMYQDALSISAYTNIARSIKEVSQVLFKSSNHADFLGYINIAKIFNRQMSLWGDHNPAYYYNFIPTYLVMNEQLFVEVLENSFSSADKISYELSSYRKRKVNFLDHIQSSPLIHFYPLNILLKLSQQPFITYANQDTISHPALTLTQEQFKRHMRDLANFLLEHSNYHICLISSNARSPLPSLQFWCKRNEILCLFDNHEPSHLMISENMTFINAIADAFKYYYDYSPTEYTSKDIVAHRLMTL